MIPDATKPKPPPPPPPPKPAPKAKPAETPKQQEATRVEKENVAEAKRKDATQAIHESDKADAKASQARQDEKAARGEVTQLTQRLERPGADRSRLESSLEAAKAKHSKLATAAGDAEQQAQVAKEKALKAADAALQAEREANTADLAVCKPQKYALANEVKDAYDAGSLGAKQQEKLFGAQGPVSGADAASRDAAQIAAAQGKPAEVARLLHDNLKGANADYAKALVENRQVQDSIKSAATQLTGDDRPGEKDVQRAVGDLTSATEIVGSQNARQITDAFAAGMKDDVVGVGHDDQFGGAMTQAVKDGKGALFGAELSNSLAKQNKTEAADDVAKGMREGLEDVREDFQKKTEAVQKLEGELGSYVRGFGPSLTPAQQEKAVDAFREKHQSEYDAFQAAGGKLASTLNGVEAIGRNPVPPAPKPQVVYAGRAGAIPVTPPASERTQLAEEAKKVGGTLPELGQTTAGMKAIGDAVEKQSKGEPSFLDHVKDYATKAKDVKGFTDNVASLVVRGTALKSIELARNGQAEAARDVVRGLERNSGLFRASPEQLKKVTEALQAFKPGMSDADLKTAAKNLDRKVAGLAGATGMDPAGTVAKSFKALGVVLSAVSVTDGWKKFDDASLKDKIGTVASTMELGADGSSMVLEAFGRSSQLAKFAGAAGGGVNAILGGVDAYNSFKDGKVPEGIASSATAVGGLIAAGAALELIPGAGTVVGTGLIVAGTAANAIIGIFRGNQEEERQEENLKTFLQGAGLSKDTADVFSNIEDGQNVGPFITQMARQWCADPKDYLRFLNQQPKEQLETFFNASRFAKQTDEDKQIYAATDPTDRSTYVTHGPNGTTPVVGAMPASLRAMAVWMDEHGLGQRSLSGTRNF